MSEPSARLVAMIEAEPDLDLEVLLNRLQMEPPALYRLLLSLAGHPGVCTGDRYRISTIDGPLTVARVRALVAEAEGSGRDIARAARLAKILGLLNERTPYGGLQLRDIAVLCEMGDRQIYRDLKTIEEDMGIPLEREGRPLRYRLKTAYLPPLGPDQALIIFLSLLQQKGSALAGHINTIKDVLVTHLFKNRYRPEDFPVQRLQSRMHIVEEALADPETVAGVFARITEALQKEVRLRIRYFVAYRGEFTTRVVEPYALLCKRQNWYLVGYCVDSQNTRTFRVDQIESAVLRSDEHFEYPADFSVQDYIGPAWGVMNTGRARRVRLRFKPSVAHRLQRTVYHPSQRIEAVAADGSLTVSFHISGLPEFRSWLVQWQDRVEVLEPDSLRWEMAGIGRRIAALYAGDQSPEESAAEELRLQQAYFKQLFEGCPQAIVLLDNEDRIMDANREFERLFQYQLDEVRGQPLNDLLIPEDLMDEAGAFSRAALGGRVIRAESVRRRRDGSRVDVSILAYPIVVEGKQVGIYGIYNDITARREAEDRLRYMSLHDPLTKLYNRAYFEEEMRRLDSGRCTPVSIVVADVDGLKLINDTRGHKAGDALLCAAAQAIRGAFREEDVVARIGGDEFAVLLPQCPEAVVRTACAKIRENIARHNEKHRDPLLSISIGCACGSGPGSMSALFREADNNMYREKLAGRCRRGTITDALTLIKSYDRLDPELLPKFMEVMEKWKEEKK